MEKIYFTKVTQDYWTAKNQLQKEAKSLMKTYERKVIKESEKADFMNGLKNAFDILNKKYPRCKPLKLDIYIWRPDEDPRIHISGVTELVLYKSVE